MPIYCATFNRRQQRSLMATPRKLSWPFLASYFPCSPTSSIWSSGMSQTLYFKPVPRRPWWLLLVYWYLPCHLESSPPSILFISLLPALLSSVLPWCFPVPSHWLHWLHSCSQMHGDLGYMSSTSCLHLALACMDWSESGESGFSKGWWVNCRLYSQGCNNGRREGAQQFYP